MRLPKPIVYAALVLNGVLVIGVVLYEWSFLVERSEGAGPVMRIVRLAVAVVPLAVAGYGAWRHWRLAEALGAILYGYAAWVTLSGLRAGAPFRSWIIVPVVLMVLFFILRLLERRKSNAVPQPR